MQLLQGADFVAEKSDTMSDTFSADLPDIAAMIKALDMMNEEVNACVREGIPERIRLCPCGCKLHFG